MKDKERNELCRQLWDEHEKSIRKLCEFKFSGNPDEVDDVVSETYLVLCNTVRRNVKIKNPKAWLYGIVNNVIKTKYREIKTQRERQLVFSELTVDLSYNIDYLDAMISDDDIEIMRSEIESELDDKERELLDYVYEKHLTSKQIAEIRNSTETAIKQRRFRLIRKIKEMAKEKSKNYL